MDVDIDTGTGALQGFSAAKVSGGLLRYHSAPSSVLASLLDDDFLPTSEDSEFARLLSDGMSSFSSLLDPKGVHQHIGSHSDFTASAKVEDIFFSHGSTNKQHSQYFGGGSSFQEHLSQNPLSAISEYGLEETVKDFCMPLPADVVQQVQNEPGCSCVSESQAIPFKSGSIVRGSSPTDAVPRLVKEESSDKLKLECGLTGSRLPVEDEKLSGQSILPTSQVTMMNNYSDVKGSKGVSAISSPRRPTALLRQSSSPAGLLSQINVEDLKVMKEKRPVEYTSGLLSADVMIDRKGLVSVRGPGPGSGDENLAEQAMQHFVDLGQRKRGKNFDIKLPKGWQRSPVDLACFTLNSFSPPSSSCPGSGDSLEGPAEESVLCKARAKRGCATHPRSIAERQRRIKISERMKKLQDLVPNLDRQASTAEMLDEVVEYVKLLQRQVQELSLNRPKCTGSCQQGGSSPH